MEITVDNIVNAKKVYCKNCTLSSCWADSGYFAKCLAIESEDFSCTRGGKYISILKTYGGFLNEYGDCEKYKKRWYKFWVKD